MIDKLIPIQERNTKIQQIYKQFKKQFGLSRMPDLYINWLSKSDNIHIVNDTGITLIAELCISEVDWYLHKLDIEPTLYHEFTHIWDMVEIRKVGEMQELFHPSLSELHAAYIEFSHRLSISSADSITLQTGIPVRSKTELVEQYLCDIKDDICDSIKGLTVSHDPNVIPHIWKQTQYLCADLCYIQQELGITPPAQIFKSILPGLFIPLMDVALKVRGSPSLVVHPTKRVQNKIEYAFNQLTHLIEL